jgi:hypothetical protein
MTLHLALMVAVATSAAAVDYHALVDAYRKDGAPQVEQLLAVSRQEADRAVTAALSSSSGWPWEDIRAAAMLHTEAGLRGQKNKDSRGAEFHVTLAQKLLDRVVELSRPQKDYAIRWYDVVPRMLRTLGGGGLGTRLQAYGESKWGRDPARASYTRGLGFEATAAREGVIPEPGETSLFSGSTRSKRTWYRRRKRSRTRSSRTLSSTAPRCISAASGCCRGSATRQRCSSASRWTTWIQQWRTLRRYFSDPLRSGNERFDAAEKLYSDALRRIPWGQSAPLALSELLSRTGRGREAREVLAGRFKLAGIVEPLWGYAANPAEELGTRFDLLRMEVWK